MKYLRKFDKLVDYQSYVGGGVDIPNVSYCEENNVVYYKSDKVTVQELIDKGYATSTYKAAPAGDSQPSAYLIQISSSCPYSLKSIIDFTEILSNTKQLNEDGVPNTFIWTEPLPENWTAVEIADVYNHSEIQDLCCPPTNMFGTNDFSSVSSLTMNYNSSKTWFGFNGPIFWNNRNISAKVSPTEFIYKTNSCPSSYHNAFLSMGSTKKIVLAHKYFYVWDMDAAFMTNSVEEIVNGVDDEHTGIKWSDVLDLRWLFQASRYIKELPNTYGITDRFDESNIIWPHHDGVRGQNTIEGIFDRCNALTKIGPVLNFISIVPPNHTSVAFRECTKLTDIRIKNINNGTWHFREESKCNIPNMDVESINYLLNNVASQCICNYGVVKQGMNWFKEAAWTPCYGLVNDNGERLYYTDSSKTATTTEIKDMPVFSSASTNSNGVANIPITPKTEGFKIILPSLHKNEISSEAIANAESKGWTIEFVDKAVVDYTY